MSNKSVAICITGWHYPRESYARIAAGRLGDVYVVSHRSRAQTPTWLSEHLPSERVLVEPNAGYDWGCFQQFLERNVWKDYEYIFFMHDDLSITDLGFVEASKELMATGCKVIGNGRNSAKRDWPRTHIECYAHSSWIPPSMSFEHDTVRGSFLATSRDVLERLGSFEVFWDRMRLSVRFGNWSMISTCGKLTDVFGEKTFGFLSEKYRASCFITEHERGAENVESAAVRSGPKDWLTRAVCRAGRACVLAKMSSKNGTEGGISGAIVRWASHR